MSVIIDDLGPAALEIRVEGRLQRGDYDVCLPLLEQRIREHGRIGLVVHLGDLQGWTPAAIYEDLKFDARHYSDIARIALVASDENKRWMATISRPFTKGEVRFFLEPDAEAARAWVRGVAGAAGTQAA